MAIQYQSKAIYGPVQPKKTNIPDAAQVRESQGYAPQSSVVNPNAANYRPTGSVLGASTVAKPSTSGQSNGGSSSGNSISLAKASPSSDNGQNDTNFLRQVYDSSRQGIQQQAPLLDQTYQQGQADINNQVGVAEQDAQAQKADYTDQYGNILKNQLQTYQDLNRQRQGTFAGLGTLDSSAFAEQQFRSDQSLGEQRGQTEKEQQKAYQEVDNRLGQVKQQAQSQLAQLGIQYQQGKQQIAQALASNNVEEAQAISSALDQVKQRAQLIQQQAIDFANQIATLKSQGYNVNVNDYANSVNQQLAGIQGYQTPAYADAGSGYISSKKNEKNPFLNTLVG